MREPIAVVAAYALLIQHRPRSVARRFVEIGREPNAVAHRNHHVLLGDAGVELERRELVRRRRSSSGYGERRA
ncbi:MAG: hypothetical protein QM775_07740 [Pirellulales bacterium]